MSTCIGVQCCSSASRMTGLGRQDFGCLAARMSESKIHIVAIGMAATATTSRLVSQPAGNCRPAPVTRATLHQPSPRIAGTIHRAASRPLRDCRCLTHLRLIVHRHEHHHPITIDRRDRSGLRNNPWLFAEPCRDTDLSVDALADQTVDARDFNML